MDPATIAIIGGTLLSAYGQMGAGQASAAASLQNAQIAEDNAGLALIKAAEEERRLRVLGRRVLGEMRAGYGASGVTMEGSPIEVLKSSAANAELDALTARFEGETRAMGYRNEARVLRASAANSSQAGILGGAASLLQGGGSLYAKKAG